MDIEQARAHARACDFTLVMPLNVSNLKFRQDVRDMCTPEMCPQGYGNSWSCPPAVPALEDMRSKATRYHQGILVQTVGTLEDPFDVDSLYETTQLHAKRFVALADRLLEATKGDVLVLGAGACARCESCTYPNEACLFPEKKVISMEASGLLVNQVCEENGALYNHGENTITFTSCCLF